ncbi:ubiquitin-protein ligase E3 [Schizosaccharomyces cryophilus OY26]|uniref:HECT-type E3 ubiquitin transferase n=1 Tax=Schizosaccharomyces cryophilus (strain OY26 / ATCC MYA-4695 / CBS 11777 / NBRC 106824 / NRRL Y48691) TaxID=653667 RepID=S9W744_SCHCR|nr:ubiquitin-protein ligase E3 [Schizosaccharomyces cryophilus OY26]EPY53705.1 ubiquitin-protein ligase E3 [Schizosaccharomyces cryophilus OY26]
MPSSVPSITQFADHTSRTQPCEPNSHEHLESDKPPCTSRSYSDAHIKVSEKLKELVFQQMGGNPVGFRWPGSSKGSHNNHGNEDELEMVVGTCICCRSSLRYPKTVPCFRCVVCLTINDLHPIHGKLDHQRKTDNPSTISATLVFQKIKETRSSLKNAKRKNDKHAYTLAILSLQQFLSRLFRNSHILLQAFSTAERVYKSCGLNFHDIWLMYEQLMSLDPSIMEEVLRATDNLLRRPKQHCYDITHYRFLLILLENPLITYNYREKRYSKLGVLKRILGILSNLGNEAHRYFICWFTQGPYRNAEFFRDKVDLINRFIGQRLSKQCERIQYNYSYNSDWQIRAAAISMALLYGANCQTNLIVKSSFYCTMVDYINLNKDFELWEQKRHYFTFCQYPFLLSMGAKVKIMQFDARRQMEYRAREAFFSSILSKKAVEPYLILRVRRTHLLADSLRQVSKPGIDLKKSLKVEFVNEEGVDAGGLKKEWLLLLSREIFDPSFGLFESYPDEQLDYVWFSSRRKTTNKEYYHLVGVLMGMAVYNSVNLDVKLPTACYKKLLGLPLTLNDVAEFRPSLTHGLRMLLEFDGDVEEMYGLNFTVNVPTETGYETVELIKDGAQISLNNENKKEYVVAYSDYLLNKSIQSQFSTFQEGFLKVCGGNALSLFQEQEMEKLVRGNEELINWDLLRATCTYDMYNRETVCRQNSRAHERRTHMLNDHSVKKIPVIAWLWETIFSLPEEKQRRLLVFMTGSDRIPATGIQSIQLRVSILGPNNEKLPIAHTCFNQLCIWEYSSKEKLKQKLNRAIYETKGFGLR